MERRFERAFKVVTSALRLRTNARSHSAEVRTLDSATASARDLDLERWNGGSNARSRWSLPRFGLEQTLGHTPPKFERSILLRPRRETWTLNDGTAVRTRVQGGHFRVSA